MNPDFDRDERRREEHLLNVDGIGGVSEHDRESHQLPIWMSGSGGLDLDYDKCE